MLRVFHWVILMISSCMFTRAVPPVLNYAGQVAVNGEAFDGNGLFKFALIDADGTTTYWSNDGTSVGGLEPKASVSIPVNGGLYTILLGNTAQQGMGAIDPAVFAQHTDAKLRIWFNDGVNGFQHLRPDRSFASVPYAFSAGTTFIENSRIISSMLADNSVTIEKLSPEVLADINATINEKRLSNEIKDKLSKINQALQQSDVDPGLLSFSIPENTKVTEFGVTLMSEINATAFKERFNFNNYGDIKYSFINYDHAGWVELNGRKISSLKPSQSKVATDIGFVTNLPNANGVVLMQNDQPLGRITGDNNVTITTKNLPPVDFNGTTDVAGSHTHKFNFKSKATAGSAYSEVNGGTNGGGSWGQVTTTSGGAHDHKVTVSSGGSGIPLNITPKSLSAKAFVYLGD